MSIMWGKEVALAMWYLCVPCWGSVAPRARCNPLGTLPVVLRCALPSCRRWDQGGHHDKLEIAMNAEPLRRTFGDLMPSEPATGLTFTPLYQVEHLLKVSGSVAQDANKVWAEMWSELKQMTTGGGLVVPEAKQGFVPACGWPEFLEKFWLLKHYLDSIQRIC